MPGAALLSQAWRLPAGRCRFRRENIEVADFPGTKVLAFDIGGTVFDWHGSIVPEVRAYAAEKGGEVDPALFANDWRRSFFQMVAKVRSKELPWMNADEIQRPTLDEVLLRFPQLGRRLRAPGGERGAGTARTCRRMPTSW